MLRKAIAGAITAGALSIPLAGVAGADPPSGHGNNGNNGNGAEHGNSVGAGGVPGRLGNLNGTPGTPYAPGQLIADLRENAANEGYDNLPEYLRDQTDYDSPGQIVSGAAHGDLTPEELQDLLDGPDEPEE